jgi:hypothetical protein
LAWVPSGEYNVNKLIGNPDESTIAGILKFARLGTGLEAELVKLRACDGASRYKRMFWYELLSVGPKTNIFA